MLTAVPGRAGSSIELLLNVIVIGVVVIGEDGHAWMQRFLGTDAAP